MPKEETLKIIFWIFCQGKGDCDKWVKGDAFALAGRTCHFGLVLACHEISDYGLILFHVYQPTLSSHLLITAASTLDSLDSWFDSYTIEVLMQPVDEK
jgi:hypothetical protein